MMNIDPVAKILIILGVVLVLMGLAWQFGWVQNLKIGRLPGDILIERENFKFYMPITTGVLVSLVFGLISWLFRSNS